MKVRTCVVFFLQIVRNKEKGQNLYSYKHIYTCVCSYRHSDLTNDSKECRAEKVMLIHTVLPAPTLCEHEPTEKAAEKSTPQANEHSCWRTTYIFQIGRSVFNMNSKWSLGFTISESSCTFELSSTSLLRIMSKADRNNVSSICAHIAHL